MAKHNYERYIRDNMGEKDVSGELLTKKANTIVRTLNFGVEILRGQTPSFTGYGKQTMDDVLLWTDILLTEEQNSSLPDKPPNEQEFRDYLYRIRLQQLVGSRCPQ